MSSRYGRNQRRRHREEIAQLRKDRARLCDQADVREADNRELHRRMSHWAGVIRRMLGPDHPFNEEVKKHVLQSLNMRPMVPGFIPKHFSLNDLIQDGPTEMIQRDAAGITLDLICHYLLVRKWQPGPEIPRSIFRLVSGDGAQSSYAIDEAALIEGRRDPRFIEWLAVELTRALNRPEAKAA